MQDTVLDPTETRKTFTTKANVTNKYLTDMPEEYMVHSVERSGSKLHASANKTTLAERKHRKNLSKVHRESLLPALNVNRDHPAIVASRERMRYEKYMDHGSQTLKQIADQIAHMKASKAKSQRANFFVHSGSRKNMAIRTSQ